jgi:hypothetical protein
MTETPSTASKTLKIVLWIVLGITGLCALCCAAVFLFSKDARQGVAVAWRHASFIQAVHKAYGAGTQVSHTHRLDESGRESILAIGIPGFDPEKAAAEQDAVWKLFAENFREGSLPVSHVAVGVPVAGPAMVDWKTEHQVPVEELVRRTGVAAPPTLLFDGGPPELPKEPAPPEPPK